MKQNYIVPDWLDKEFVQKVLSQKHGTSVSIDSFTVDSATQKGDNFASEMFRIIVSYSVNGEGRVKNLILKKSHTDPKISGIFERSDMYRKEINCYRVYLPEFQKILQSVGEQAKLSPEVIYYDLDHQVLVMEDMAVEGYRTAEKSTRFSLDLAKMTLRKLALYHAASVIYNQRVAGELEKVKNTIFESDDFDKMFETILGAAIDEVHCWGKEYEKYIPELEFVKTNILTICEDALQPSEGMGVFIHGDMWLNNILVQYGENKSAKEILLIDFQLSGWASRAIDLIYFIFTTLNEEDYKESFDDVLRMYNDEYRDILKKFDYKDIPEFSAFKKEVEKKLPYGES